MEKNVSLGDLALCPCALVQKCSRGIHSPADGRFRVDVLVQKHTTFQHQGVVVTERFDVFPSRYRLCYISIHL